MEALLAIDLQLISRNRSRVCSTIPADCASRVLISFQSPELLFSFKAVLLTLQGVSDFHLMNYRITYPCLLMAWRNFSVICFQSLNGIICYSVCKVLNGRKQN